MIIQDNDSTERAPGNHPDSPHPVLTPLSWAEAAHLIRLCHQAATERGIAASYDGAGGLLLANSNLVANSGLVADAGPIAGSSPAGSGLVAGLTNLARIVSVHRQHRWPQLIGTHFDQLASSLLHGPPPPPADPERDLYLRLVPTSALPPDWTLAVPEFVHGLLAVPATYDQGVIAMHLDPSDFGMTWPEAQQVGLANLRRLTDTLEYGEHDDVRVAVLSGSTFAASRALVLDTVLRESLHVESPPFGVLAAMPVRDLLLVHVITDLSVITALGMMVNLTGKCHLEQPGPLSPWVYLVTEDGWHPAIENSDDQLRLRLSPRMLALAHKRLE